MLGASYSLELSKIVISNYRNPEETEEGMASISPKDVSCSGILTEYVRRATDKLKVFNCLVQKEVIFRAWC